jgi:transposase
VKVAKLAAVSRATVQRILDLYESGSLAAVRTFHWKTPASALTPHRPLLEEEFAARPPHTVGEACRRIEELTGVRRGETRVREFLRDTMKLRWRKVAAVPLPPRMTLEEHAAGQADFLNTKLEPRLAEAQAGQREVLFVDAAHLVLSSFLGWMWCSVRKYVKAASGRQRYNVLGAFNAVTHELIRVTNDKYITATTVCELLHKIAARGVKMPITLVLDNARYQHCQLVEDLARTLGIELLFLPSYSPNLNLIERLWKFVKKEVLNSRHQGSFADFKQAIDKCLDELPTTHRAAMQTLMTLKFQTFDNVSMLAA